MILNKEELLNSIKSRLGDDTSDEALKFLEDVSDTISDYETKSSQDWKSKYEENDAEWRRKYKERFFEGTPVQPADVGEPDTPISAVEDKPLTFEALFTSENK